MGRMSVPKDNKNMSKGMGCKYTSDIKINRELLGYMNKQAEHDHLYDDWRGLYGIRYASSDRSLDVINVCNKTLPDRPIEKRTDWTISFDKEVDMTQNGFKARPRRMTPEEKIHLFEVIYGKLQKESVVEEWIV